MGTPAVTADSARCERARRIQWRWNCTLHPNAEKRERQDPLCAVRLRELPSVLLRLPLCLTCAPSPTSFGQLKQLRAN